MVVVPEPREIGKRFIDNGDGSIYDRRTKLTWKRCSVGLEGYYCQHGDIRYLSSLQMIAEFGEKKHNSDGWRIPTIDELSSLVYCGNSLSLKEALYSGCGKGKTSYQSPTIQLDAFPNTAQEKYWSSTTIKSDFEPEEYWANAIFFGAGSKLKCGGKSHHIFSRCAIRLVRN